MTSKLIRHLVLIYIFQWSFAKMLTSFNVEFENVLACPNNNELESPLRNLKFVKINRTSKTLSLQVTFKRPLDENVQIIFEKWGNAGWVQLPLIPLQPNACKFLNNHLTNVWIDSMTAMGVPHPEKCPTPAGNYSLQNYPLQLKEMKIPLWGGRYKFTSTYWTMTPRKMIFCNIYLINVFEKL